MTDYRSVIKEPAVDLGQKTRSELVELLQRQVKILADRKFIQKLPDGGEKMKKFKRSIEEALRRLDSVDNLANLVRKLDITHRTVIDSDDDDDDDEEPNVYETLATNGVPTKTTKHEAPPPCDLPFVEKLTQQMEEKQNLKTNRHERLPLNKSVSNSSKSKVDDGWNRIRGTWLETAVTPPPATFKESKEIPLRESYELQKAHSDKHKKLLAGLASKYLRDDHETYDSPNFTSYRETVEISDEDDDN